MTAKLDTALKSCQLQLADIQANQNCGEYVWRIKNWKETLKQASSKTDQEICSDVFFSHKNGYKMYLELIPNNKNCISLYVCFTKGEYDNILKWPFRDGVNFELINQQSGLTHTSRTKKYEDCKSHVAWTKPSSERKPTGVGFDDFIELSELYSNSALTSNDEIMIKATLVFSSESNLI